MVDMCHHEHKNETSTRSVQQDLKENMSPTCAEYLEKIDSDVER